MIIYLQFNCPDDQDQATLAIKGADLYCVVADLDETLRGWIKHGREFSTPVEALQSARDALHDAMESRNVSIDMVQ